MLKDKLLLWIKVKLGNYKQYIMQHPVKLFVYIFIITCIGNFLYWGKPTEYASDISPDEQYKLVYYYPDFSLYGWLDTIHPYFMKVYIFDGKIYRYACTSPIRDTAAMINMNWPTESFDAIWENLELTIQAKPLREGFISFAPTLERICP